MRTWTTETTVTGLPDEVLALLTEPDAIARWTPVPFELIDLDTDRLVATGPVSIDVEYRLRPAPQGSNVSASVSVNGRGLIGRVIAEATDALLAAGALDLAMDRIRRQFEPALAT